MLDLIVNSLGTCLEPINLLAMAAAVTVGVVVGCLPGFGAAEGLVLVLPLTYSMEPSTAFVALAGIYLGAEYGGSISAILINTPGTPAAIVTSFDGYPMAKSGKARRALLLSNCASFTGGMFGAVAMLLFMPLLGTLVLRFGSGEIFLLAGMGLFLVGSISRGNMLKGVVSAALGLFFTFFGAETITGFSRFDFDIPILIGGLPIIGGMLAMFAVPQMMELALSAGKGAEKIEYGKMGIRENFSLFRKVLAEVYGRFKITMIRSGLFGLLIGIIPGVGASVASMAAYSSARKYSAQPEEFGRGSAEGIVAPEAANNALVGGSLIPVIALGIPGSPAAAIFMASIFLHGMTPGPNFLTKQGELVYILITALFLCSVIQLILGALTIGALANILRIPASRLFPVVIAICTVGAYVARSIEFDVLFFVGLGVFAFFMARFGLDMGALVLGAFLGNTMEVSLNELLSIAPARGGVPAYFFGRPIAACMLAGIGLYCVYLILRAWRSPRECGGSVGWSSGPAGWMGRRGADCFLSLVLMSLAAFFLYMARDYPLSSRLFPSAVLMVILACMGVLFLKTVLRGDSYAGCNASPFAGLAWGRVCVLCALIPAYGFFVTELGFYATSFVFILFSCELLDRWNSSGAKASSLAGKIAYAFISVSVMYLVFECGLSVGMPSPLLI